MSRMDRAVIAQLLDANPLDDMIGERVKLSRPNAKGIRGGPCLCNPVKGKSPLWVDTHKHTYGCLKGGCGGDTFTYLQKFEGLGFAEALRRLGGETIAADPERQAELAADREKRRQDRERAAAKLAEDERRTAYGLFEAAGPGLGTLLAIYLEHREVGWLDTPALRYAPAEPYWWCGDADDARPQVIHVGPCMHAAIQGPDGKFLGLHRTWLDPRLGTSALPSWSDGKAEILAPTGEPLAAKKMRAGKKGGSIWLTRSPPEGVTLCCVVGEGIETTGTALRALRLHGRRGPDGYGARVACDLGNMAGGAVGLSSPHPDLPLRTVPSPEPDMRDHGMLPPAWADSMILLGDGDSDPYVTRALLERGRARYVALGTPTVIRMAPPATDFNSMARRGLAAPAADEAVLEETGA